jgi:UDP-glucose:(heptosyl)LPS alpha-1,3-glucosyltransferase
MTIRIAVVSPFIDKRHGTERCLAEEVERLARDYEYDVHLYSQRVEDLPLEARITWHKVPDIPGPHLAKYVWWFVANHLWRWWDGWVGHLRFDLVYSPGINCLDADVMTVHIVFASFYEQVKNNLKLTSGRVRLWPRLIHRRLYYFLIMMLERIGYSRRSATLAAISSQTARDVGRFREPTSTRVPGDGHPYSGDVPVVYYGVDLQRFNPESRARRRAAARQELNLAEDSFVLLLIGNDWRSKGLPCLLEAVRRLSAANLMILVVGHDDPSSYQALIARSGLRVRFAPLRFDVEFYYAAADAYVGPSLTDAFALPPAEAMACGLPVIVSSRAGVSELVSDGVDGLVLHDPRDAEELAMKIRLLYDDAGLRHRLSERAAQTIRSYTWDEHTAQLNTLFQRVVQR